MKLELSRADMEKAVNCFIAKQGVDLDNHDVKYVFGRETVKVELQPKNEDNDIHEGQSSIDDFLGGENHQSPEED